MRTFEHTQSNEQNGQAAIELLVALPIAFFLLIAGWQVAATGHAWWALSESARVAARTAYVSSRGDTSRLGDSAVKTATNRAATAALPKHMLKSHQTRTSESGIVSVTARLPLAPPLAAVLGRGPSITASSRASR